MWESTSDWPSPGRYAQAIADGGILVPALRQATMSADGSRPHLSLGSRAVVCKASIDGRAYAIRLWTAPPRHAKERYEAIAARMDRGVPNELTPAHWVDEGIEVEGRRYPMLVMDWVDGDDLATWLGRHAPDTDQVDQVLSRLRSVVHALRTDDIAHGALSPSNIIIDSTGSIQLISHDRLWLPELADRPPDDHAWWPEMDHDALGVIEAGVPGRPSPTPVAVEPLPSFHSASPDALAAVQGSTDTEPSGEPVSVAEAAAWLAMAVGAIAVAIGFLAMDGDSTVVGLGFLVALGGLGLGLMMAPSEDDS